MPLHLYSIGIQSSFDANTNVLAPPDTKIFKAFCTQDIPQCQLLSLEVMLNNNLHVTMKSSFEREWCQRHWAPTSKRLRNSHVQRVSLYSNMGLLSCAISCTQWYDYMSVDMSSVTVLIYRGRPILVHAQRRYARVVHFLFYLTEYILTIECYIHQYLLIFIWLRL